MQLRSLATALSLAVICGSSSLGAQQHIQVPTQSPRAEDVSSLDGIMKAFYEVVSGPAGQPREWARDRTLYLPDIRFVQTGVDRTGKANTVVMTHQEFVDGTDGGMVKNGFFETEIHRQTRTFGNVSTILSSYDMRSKPDGAVLGRGVNSLLVVWDGKRYWIASVAWDDERPGNPIPADLLGE
ncbi:MAG TPA: hypothetical protein VFU03_09110 [Gemmatimonadales bacterium]|nr:hypothetical protein [Gemmatimonadales bacterium]